MSDNLEHALAELTGGGTTQSAFEKVRAFERWWQRRAKDDALSEKLVLAYLLDHEHWAWNTARTAAAAVSSHYRATIGIELYGQTLRAYLARRGREGRSRLPLVEPLRLPEARTVAAAMASREQTPEDTFVAALRDGVVLLRRRAEPDRTIEAALTDLARLRIDEDDGALIGAGERILDRLSPKGVTLWAGHLVTLANCGRLTQRSGAALKRAKIAPGTPVAALTDAQWAWLWRSIDHTMPRRIRDRAYILVGLTHARRHAELKRLDLEHITATSEGFRVEYDDRKGRSHITKHLNHLDPGDRPCGEECAACAMQDLLDWEHECMGRTTGPAFATRYGGQVRRMSRQNARHRIRAATALLGEHPWGSTRSLRAGAATSAWEAGWTLKKIAREVTCHNDVSQADVYVRKCGVPGTGLQLNLASGHAETHSLPRKRS